MNTLFDKLNLRPQERRLVMIAAVVLFAVLNAWLVLPHFKDWVTLLGRLRQARKTVEIYTKEKGDIPKLKEKLARMQEEGVWIPADDQALTLLDNVRSLAAEANLFVQRLSPAGGGPIPNNPFFEEQKLTLTAVAGEPELVDFLRRLGAGTSLVRVRDMNLKPDPSGIKLGVNLTIVGSYQKKPGAKSKTTGPGRRMLGQNPT